MNVRTISLRVIGVYLLLAILTLFVISCGENEMMEDDPCADGPEVSVSVSNATIGNEDGSVSLNITGGAAPYEASLDGSNFQSTTSFNNLAAGDYTVVIRDAEGCDVSASFTIAEVDPCAKGFEITLETTASFDTENSGSINVAVSGGESPYMYRLNDGDFGTSSEFTGLAAGSYTVVVQDNFGCTNQMSVDLEEVPFVSYMDDIKTIIETHCLLSGCHGNNASLPNWGDLSVLQANAENVKTRTSNKSMPPSSTPGDPLNDEQIAKIANWVDAGAPNN